MNGDSALHRLCTLCGVERSFRDAWGEERLVPEETLRAILGAMGFDTENDRRIEDELRRLAEASWRRIAAPVAVATEGVAPVLRLTAPRTDATAVLRWTLEQEEGDTIHGEAAWPALALEETFEADGMALDRRALSLPVTPPLGYHRLVLRLGLPGDRMETAEVRLIVAPHRCHTPSALQEGGRLWGLSVQLYALTSERNWGIGDFGDLARLVDFCARAGGALVGLNPLHALFAGKPNHCSPYAPSSRLAHNPLYLDVEAIPDLADCPEAQTLMETPEFRAELAAIRGRSHVDYPAVAARKFNVLALLYRAFRARHLDPLGADATGPGAAFRRFQADGGPTLARVALFEALAEHFGSENAPDYAWRGWPEAYRDPLSDAVATFAETHRERVEFHQYLQWRAREQLGAVAARCRTLGMEVGLYHDLAVGADRDGADGWAQSAVLADAVSVGAPPDPLNLKGQNWGFPPWNPLALRNAAYRPFIEMLRANMREAGALRIDHVLGLNRLYWIPRGAEADAGGYVRYPIDDLLAIVALESRRNRCLVIGEDLGTLPEGLRERLQEKDILSCRLLHFERTADGTLPQPDDYPRRALVAVGTHDLPTLSGFWRGDDLALRARLGLFPSEEVRAREVAARPLERAAILEALRQADLAPADAPDPTTDGVDPPSSLVKAIHRFLARTPAMIMMVNIEDLIGETAPINLPGTGYEYPNWQRKIAIPVEGMEHDPRIAAICRVIAAERSGSTSGSTGS